MISVRGALREIGIYIIASGVISFFAWLYLRNLGKAFFLTFLLLAFNFFFGYFHDVLKSFFPGSFVIKYSVILVTAFLIFLSLSIALKKITFTSQRVVVFLNGLLLLFILIDTFSLIRKIIQQVNAPEPSINLQYSGEKLPDIYLIITDEYAGEKDLKEVCSFDNSLFLDSLRRLGFFVATNSKSNYNYTVHSIGSILNMEYIPADSSQIRKSMPIIPLRQIFDNRVVQSFEKAGYGFFNYSAFDIKNAPSKNPNMFVPANTGLFTSQTLINRVKRDAFISVAIKLNIQPIIRNYGYQNLNYNARVYEQTLRLNKTKIELPKFVYTHLEMPHFPYYYNENGDLLSYEKVKQYQPGDTKGYVAYLKYTNDKLLRFVNEILTESKTSPIIILMSDHGYRSYPGNQVDYSFINLFSIYFKDGDYSKFSDSISAVNVFRALLNSKFGQKLPMLADSTIDVR